MNSNIFFLILATEFQANHNKDYSVVKTNKAGQLAFFNSLEILWINL